MMKEYEVWQEGYATTGNSAKASLIGKVEAKSFYDACVKLCSENEYFNKKSLTIWGCKLYPTEKEARKCFG